VESVPALFLYRDNKLYNVPVKAPEIVIDFCVHSYNRETPISYMMSAFGPLGMIRGVLMQIGQIAVTAKSYMLGKADKLTATSVFYHIFIVLMLTVGGVLLSAYILSRRDGPPRTR
jgi:hypothetical protein